MIEIKNLTIVDGVGRPVVDHLSLSVRAGERVGIVGESGSGKTTLALALLCAVRPGLRVAGGSIMVNGADVLSLRGSALRALRGGVISYLPQDPPSALTPTIRVRGQIAELAADRSTAAVARRLADVGLPGDELFQRRYPHQLSGGQQQRLALARTTSADPRVLVLDEPTTGLDAVAQNLVLDQIAELARRRDLTLLFITHDLPAAVRMSDRLVVLRDGVLVDQGPLPEVLSRPATSYTRELVQAVPTVAQARRWAVDIVAAPAVEPLLRVRDLHASYRDGRRRLPVVDGVSFEVGRGECVALLGVSGSGKTTIARCISGTHRRDSGEVLVDGEVFAAGVKDRSVAQRGRIQLVPQHSAGSLNPRRTVGAAIARPLRLLGGMDQADAVRRTRHLLEQVGLAPRYADRLPGQLSGGQRQRVTIARALAAGPQILVCDEMTSSLDVRVQAGVLDLIAELRRELGLAVVLITHDLGVMARAADRVLVLRDGVVCEQGRVADVLSSPGHDWTRALVRAAAALPELPGHADSLEVRYAGRSTMEITR